jgi:hypothetical protein
MSVWIVKLAGVLGLSLTSGINLYATVAVVGLVTKFELIHGLPPEFQAFNNDFIIVLAILLYSCEFLADKIPAFDSVWDSVHTAIRPFGAALIAMTVVGEAGPTVEICAGLLGASLGLATHTAKAGTRLVVNTSPEPFSNAALSVGEDLAVAGIAVLVMSHPYLSLVVSLTIVILLVRYGPGLWRGAVLILKAVTTRVVSAFSTEAQVSLTSFVPDAIQQVVDARIVREEKIEVSQRCHARKVRGCGWNKRGYLIVTDRRVLFAFRRFFRTRTVEWNIADLEKAELNRRFLMDLLRIKGRGKFSSYIFLKNQSRVAAELLEHLNEAIEDEPPARAEQGGTVIPLTLGDSRPA